MKFLLLIGLIPVFVSFFARKVLSDRVLRQSEGDEVSLCGRELVDRILKETGTNGVEVVEKKRPFMVVGPQQVVLSPSLSASRRARDVAEAGLLAGMVLMARKQDSVVRWRVWAAKFGAAFPAFTMIVMAFALVIGRLGAGWGVGIVAASLGVTTILLWLTLPVERTAAGVVAVLLEESAVVSRRSEGEKLATLVKALGWRRIIPGAISWIGGK